MIETYLTDIKKLTSKISIFLIIIMILIEISDSQCVQCIFFFFLIFSLKLLLLQLLLSASWQINKLQSRLISFCWWIFKLWCPCNGKKNYIYSIQKTFSKSSLKFFKSLVYTMVVCLSPYFILKSQRIFHEPVLLKN